MLHKISERKTKNAVVVRFDKDFNDVLELQTLTFNSYISFTQFETIAFELGFYDPEKQMKTEEY